VVLTLQTPDCSATFALLGLAHGGMKMCRQLLIAAMMSLGLGACGNDSSTAGQPTAGARPGLPPACPPDIAELRTGANGTLRADDSGEFSVRIADAHLPLANDFNDIEIVVLDGSGTPLPDAQLTWVCAWMAVHTHGSTPKRIDKLGEGRFKLVRQNLAMSGPWELRLWVAPHGDSEDYQPDVEAGGLNGNACSPSNASDPTWNIAFDLCVPDR
jgi:hypothetical protein